MCKYAYLLSPLHAKHHASSHVIRTSCPLCCGSLTHCSVHFEVCAAWYTALSGVLVLCVTGDHLVILHAGTKPAPQAAWQVTVMVAGTAPAPQVVQAGRFIQCLQPWRSCSWLLCLRVCCNRWAAQDSWSMLWRWVKAPANSCCVLSLCSIFALSWPHIWNCLISCCSDLQPAYDFPLQPHVHSSWLCSCAWQLTVVFTYHARVYSWKCRATPALKVPSTIMLWI